MSRASKRACKEAIDALTLGTGDDLERSRAEFHLQHCADCQQHLDFIDEMREAVLSADDTLDDMTRARVRSKLVEAMEAGARRGAERPRWGKRAGVVAAALLLAAVGGGALWWSMSGAGSEPSGAALPTALSADRVLRPVAIVEGSAPWSDPTLHLGQKVSRLKLPAGVALRSKLMLGDAELTLFGPLDLTVERASARQVTLRLQSGILLGQFSGGRGHALSIRSPGAVTEIVGTFFAVEAHEGQTRVSVARGKVKVGPESGQGAVQLGADSSWSTGRPKLRRTPAPVAALFVRHDRRDDRVEKQTTSTGQLIENKNELPKTGQDTASTARTDRRTTAPGVRSRPRARSTRAVPSAQANPRPPSSSAKPTDTEPGTPSHAGDEPATASRAGAKDTDRNKIPNNEGVEAPRAAERYRAAEKALASGDRRGARRNLEQIIARHPKDPLCDAARYELSLLLRRSGESKKAAALLRDIGQGEGNGSRFSGPAHFLRCRLLSDAGKQQQAGECYRAHRERFPTSPHDQRVLQRLIRLSTADSDCRRTRGLIRDYLALYPGGPFAKEARRLARECKR